MTINKIKRNPAKKRKTMKKFDIPISYSLQSTVTVEANTIEEAIKIATDNFYSDKTEVPKGTYIENSLDIDSDFIKIK